MQLLHALCITLQHECQARPTRARHEQHKWDVSGTSATQTTQVKIFDFDKDTSENIFSHPYISYMTNEILRGEEEQFHSKNYLLQMPCSHANMLLKSATQKLNFIMAKAIPKRYALDWSCKLLTFWIFSESNTRVKIFHSWEMEIKESTIVEITGRNYKHMKTAVNLTIQFFESRYQKKYLIKVWSFLTHPPKNDRPVYFWEIE